MSVDMRSALDEWLAEHAHRPLVTSGNSIACVCHRCEVVRLVNAELSDLGSVYDLAFHAGEVDADKTAAQKVESLVRQLVAADALISVVMQWAGFNNPTPQFHAGKHGNLYAAIDRYRAAMGLPASMNAESKEAQP